MLRRTRSLLSVALLVAFGTATVATPALAAVPTNDDFADATAVALAVPVTGEASEATKEAGEPCWEECRSVWYEFTPETSGPYVATIPNASGMTIVAVFAGDSLSTLRQLAWADGYYFGPARARFDADAGATYHIQVLNAWPDDFGPMPFTLTVDKATPPSNDNFDGASVIDALPYESPSIRTTWATSEAGEPSCTIGGRTVWWTYTAQTSQDVKVSDETCVYTGDSLETLQKLDTGSIVALAAGTTYRFQVDGGWQQIESAASLSVRPLVRPTLTLTHDKRGTVTKAGEINLSGTYTCSDPAQVVSSARLEVQVAQSVGRLPRAQASASDWSVTCDGQTRNWSFALTSATSTPFWSGTAQVSASLAAYAGGAYNATVSADTTTKLQSVKTAKG